MGSATLVRTMAPGMFQGGFARCFFCFVFLFFFILIFGGFSYEKHEISSFVETCIAVHVLRTPVRSTHYTYYAVRQYYVVDRITHLFCP